MSFVHHLTLRKPLLLAVMLSGLFVGQSAFALQCIVYQKFGEGEWMCGGWQKTPCEINPSSCLPTRGPPDPGPNTGTDNGRVPTSGPNSGNGVADGSNPPTPDQMSCSQLRREYVLQQRKLNSLIQAIATINDELDTGNRNLAGAVSQPLIDQVKSEADRKCNIWTDYLSDHAVRTCKERNGREICTTRQLSASEKAMFNSCNATTQRWTSLIATRGRVIKLLATGSDMKKTLLASRDAVTAYMNTLDDAKGNKGCRN